MFGKEFNEWYDSLSDHDKEFFDGLKEYVEIGFKAGYKMAKEESK